MTLFRASPNSPPRNAAHIRLAHPKLATEFCGSDSVAKQASYQPNCFAVPLRHRVTVANGSPSLFGSHSDISRLSGLNDMRGSVAGRVVALMCGDHSAGNWPSEADLQNHATRPDGAACSVGSTADMEHSIPVFISSPLPLPTRVGVAMNRTLPEPLDVLWAVSTHAKLYHMVQSA